MQDKKIRNVLTLGELLESAGLDLNTELIISSDVEGKNYRTVTDVETDVVVDPNSDDSDLVVYSSEELADEIGITEEAWEEMKRSSNPSIILY